MVHAVNAAHAREAWAHTAELALLRGLPNFGVILRYGPWQSAPMAGTGESPTTC
jgi:hypothetical protein